MVTVLLPLAAAQVPAVTVTLPPFAAITPEGWLAGLRVLTSVPAWSRIWTVMVCGVALEGLVALVENG